MAKLVRSVVISVIPDKDKSNTLSRMKVELESLQSEIQLPEDLITMLMNHLFPLIDRFVL